MLQLWYSDVAKRPLMLQLCTSDVAHNKTTLSEKLEKGRFLRKNARNTEGVLKTHSHREHIAFKKKKRKSYVFYVAMCLTPYK